MGSFEFISPTLVGSLHKIRSAPPSPERTGRLKTLADLVRFFDRGSYFPAIKLEDEYLLCPVREK